MSKDRGVVVERVNGRDNEYIIKDYSGITAGRVFIIEISDESRYCTLRLRFYRDDSGCIILKDALSILLRTLFNKGINKVNVVADENVNTSSFVDLGFYLEGIFEENLYANGIYRDELVFGITARAFENQHKTTSLELKGKNVDVRVLNVDDAEVLLAYYIRNKEHLRLYEPARDESFYSLGVQKKILIESYKQFLNGVSLNCGIYKNSSLIGKIQISNIVHGVFKSAFVGYSIDELSQGKGYMKEALNLVLDYSFKELELHRIEASTLVDNIKSQKVLRSCGFTELGLNKEYLFINGGWRDHITFYKINNDL
jgi:[ribosomal protein S5]-alanine N-acetyltransferase